jgi:hypothetical protein
MSLPRTGERSTAEPADSHRSRLRRVVSRVALASTILAALVLWRSTSLRGLPVIPEPFDLARDGTVAIPDEENAFTYFRRATDRFVGHESDLGGGTGIYEVWSQVPPEAIRSLEQNREALDFWYEGTRRHRAVYMQPGTATMETVIPVTQRLRSFSHLARLKAMRLRLDGDLAGAWRWILADLRCGMLSGQNGCFIERLVGINIYGGATAEAMQWADDPKLDVGTLRRALDDVLEIEAIAPSYATILRQEYFAIRNSLDDPEILARALRRENAPARWSWQASVDERLSRTWALIRREPERSRRVVRLILANWLSACDEPDEARQARAVQFGKLVLFRPAPGESAPIEPAELARWFETTVYARRIFHQWLNLATAKSNDERARATLIIHLAGKLYAKEHGKEPASPEDLVGPYLKALPAGYPRIAPNPKPPGSSR